MRSQKQGLKYVCSQTISAIDSSILITLLVLRVQDKVAQAIEQSILVGALATNRIHDLSIAEAACKEKRS
jgi:hypothetical protein